MIILTKINNAILQEIKDVYGSSDLSVVKIVFNDILSRYFTKEYFHHDLSVEQTWEQSIDEIILAEIEREFIEIFVNNGYADVSSSTFPKITSFDEFVISEYSIGRVYALAEMYYKVTGQSIDNNLVEMLTIYDLVKKDT